MRLDSLTTMQQLRIALGLDYWGETSRLLTPMEIEFTRKYVLRPFFLLLAAGFVPAVLLGLGLNYPFPSFRNYFGFFVSSIFWVGYPSVLVMKVRADLAEGKAATVTGSIIVRKISQVSTLLIHVSSPDPFLPVVLTIVDGVTPPAPAFPQSPASARGIRR